MKFQHYMLASCLALTICAPAMARDTALQLPFQEAVQRAVDDGVLDGSVKFYLAGTGGKGKIVAANVVANNKTNAFNKTDEAACDHVLRSSLIQLEKNAKASHAKSVRNIVSYYKRVTTSSAKTYECHVGTAVAGVTLKGDLAR